MPVVMDYLSSGFDSTIPSLFTRDEPCIKCPPITPACPVCAADEICSQTSQSCHQCQATSCIKMSSASGNVPPVPSPVGSDGGGPNVGAIAGGVVGGVVVIAIATYLIWRFFIKGRAIDYDDDDYDEDDGTGYPVEKSTNYAQSTTTRTSTTTRNSVASTAFTRASNVIQIAFIPGITDRNGGAPPVPPIPVAGGSRSSTPGSTSSPISATSPFSEASTQDHYFMPNDLRGSTWSGYTDDSSLNTRGSMARSSVARSSMARQSITPSLMRESVASTIYNHDVAVQQQAAQTAARGRANVVQVKQSPTGSPLTLDVPTVPKIDFAKYGQAGQAPRVVEVNKANQDTSNAPIPVASEPQSEEAKREELTAKIKEAARRASQQPTHGGLGSVNQQSNPENPFADNSDNVIPE